MICHILYLLRCQLSWHLNTFLVVSSLHSHEYRIVAQKGAKQPELENQPSSQFYVGKDGSDGSTLSKSELSTQEFGISIQQ